METHPGRISRRSFNGLVMASPLIIGAADKLAADPAEVHCYIGRSNGTFLGGLFTADPNGQVDAIKNIREITKYYRTLRIRTTEKLKVRYFPELLKYILSQTEMRFVCMECQFSEATNALERDVQQTEVYRRLLSLGRVPPGELLTVHLVDEGRTDQDIVSGYANNIGSWKLNFQRGFINKNELLQLSHFLTGLMHCQSENNVREDIIKKSCKILGIDKMSELKSKNYPTLKLRSEII